MNPIVIVLALVTITEIFFTGFGLTFILLCVSRVGYCLNTFGAGLKVKTCAIWEGIAIGWVIMKAIIFKSVVFNWKYLLAVTIYAIVSALIELYDEATWSYVIEEIQDDKNGEREEL